MGAAHTADPGWYKANVCPLYPTSGPRKCTNVHKATHEQHTDIHVPPVHTLQTLANTWEEGPVENQLEAESGYPIRNNENNKLILRF